MEVQCLYCQGKGKVYVRSMLLDSYKKKVELVDCPRCFGTGRNPKMKRSICYECKESFAYHKDAEFVPRFCPDCKDRHAQKYQIENYAPPNTDKPCRGLDGVPCGNLVAYNRHWKYIPSLCMDCKAEVKARKRMGAKFYTKSLIPDSWNSSISFLNVDKKNGIIVFKGQGTSGADFLVRWDDQGVIVWVDEGLPVNHELRHRDPR